MALTLKVQVAALGFIARQDWGGLAELIETARYLNREEKMRLLSMTIEAQQGTDGQVVELVSLIKNGGVTW